MISGSVNARREATVRLHLIGPGGQTRDVTVVIDTGYNGTLTLPLAVINSLGLASALQRWVKLADGSRSSLQSYAAELLWEGQRRQILVLAIDEAPLLGTVLLDGCHLGIDFVPGGAVAITPLGSTP
jgi:clan AA aspartic protease